MPLRLLIELNILHYLMIYVSETCVPATLRLIMNMYNVYITKNASYRGLSSQFTLGNGVKQEGVFSPILFTVYLDS